MSAYRYTLHRDCGALASNERLCWVMLNPSTADTTTDDPTIRRCIGFTRAAGYAELEVVNLYAARATNPHDLVTVKDPVGPDNDHHIASAFHAATDVVFAWGGWASPNLDVVGRAAAVWSTCRSMMRLPLCLGTTKDGSPRHPLYVGAHQLLVPWQPWRDAAPIMLAPWPERPPLAAPSTPVNDILPRHGMPRHALDELAVDAANERRREQDRWGL